MSEFRRIRVCPVAGALGAEIEGARLDALDDETFAEIHQALLRHHVVFFRDQPLAPGELVAFGRRFGTLNIHPYVRGMAHHAEVMEIIKEPDDALNFGGGWHSDMSFLEEPAMGSVLHAVEVPDVGGDTLFANQHLAYERLSPGMQRLLSDLKAVHTASGEYGARGPSAQSRESMSVSRADSSAPSFLHPVVRTHPETGQKALYVNAAFTQKFEGMTRAESRPLLRFLFDHCTEASLTCRFRWTRNAVAFWDNRSVQHYALNDYSGARRHMRRVTIDGDRPF
jgi:taurine dioxygenase